MKKRIWEKIQNGLIVSCQAREGWAMYGAEIMASFAQAAQEGGAVGIRATGVDNILAIRKRVDLPVIGINKQFIEGYDVYITPTYQSAKDIIETGAEILALDATDRKRPGGEKVADIVQKIRDNYPDVLLMGEISTLEEAKNAEQFNFDFISTTLSGYTENSQDIKSVNLQLIKDIKKYSNVPIIAEGKIKTAKEARLALEAGACAVVVGTSITRPEIITSRYVEEIKRCKKD